MSAKSESNAVHIYFLIDMRPYFENNPPVFGNYIVSGLIRIPQSCWHDTAAMTDTIKKQLDDNLARLRNHETIFPMLINKAVLMLGRKRYAALVRNIKERGKVPMSYIFSNLGNIDKINSTGSVNFSQAIAVVPQPGIMMTSSTIGGRINFNFSYPSEEISRNDIKLFASEFDNALGGLLK
jgi:NRPS condensation-like uncharacterized protein